jgi:hypothetical protein
MNPQPEAPRVAWLPKVREQAISKAVARGVARLKQTQLPNGAWPAPSLIANPDEWFKHGLAALPALTLLECGVPPEDEHIQKAARLVRAGVPVINTTYELALCILFLDRLGQPSDPPLIRRMALRLIAFQTEAGGWTYTCPVTSESEEQNLLTILRHQQRDRGPDAPSAEEARLARDALPEHIRGAPALQDPTKPKAKPMVDRSDNSNTQFAILGVWTARRYRLPMERTLELIARRFKDSQTRAGTWEYAEEVRAQKTTPAMTGAGLLGLAVGLGLAKPDAEADKVPPRNPAVEKALRALAETILPSARARVKQQLGSESLNLYFLWTVERVAVLYNLRRIGGKDWYEWGAELIVNAQRDDGGWAVGGYPGVAPAIDTSFALLFLQRANPVQDLTKKLEFVIDTSRVRETSGTSPGER